jgi:hypothetical protein
MFYRNWKLVDQGFKNILLNEMSYKFQERKLGKRPKQRLKILVVIQKQALKQKRIISYIRVKKLWIMKINKRLEIKLQKRALKTLVNVNKINLFLFHK